jgi:hypothetical protein
MKYYVINFFGQKKDTSYDYQRPMSAPQDRQKTGHWKDQHVINWEKREGQRNVGPPHGINYPPFASHFSGDTKSTNTTLSSVHFYNENFIMSKCIQSRCLERILPSCISAASLRLYIDGSLKPVTLMGSWALLGDSLWPPAGTGWASSANTSWDSGPWASNNSQIS